MKNLLFLLFPLFLASCTTTVITEKECDFACMNEDHKLNRIEKSGCLCNMRDKRPMENITIPQPKVTSEK